MFGRLREATDEGSCCIRRGLPRSDARRSASSGWAISSSRRDTASTMASVERPTYQPPPSDVLGVMSRSSSNGTGSFNASLAKSSWCPGVLRSCQKGIGKEHPMKYGDASSKEWS